MKKQKIANFLKLGVLLFGISLLLWNCEKEKIYIETSQQTILEKQINYLTTNEFDTDILSKIQTRTGFKILSDYQDKNANYQNSLDLENIIQVIDTLGNTNYTLRLNVKDNDRATFYNLTVNQNTERNEPLMFVYKYIADENHLNDFIQNGYNFQKFTGKVFKYNIDNFLAGHSQYVSKGSALGDDCPCGEIIVIDGDTTGGGGSGSGSGITCSQEFITISLSNCCSNGDCYPHYSENMLTLDKETRKYVDKGAKCSGNQATILGEVCTDNKSKSANTSNATCLPCEGGSNGEPSGTGDTGVLLPLPMSALQIVDILDIAVGSAEYNWLNDIDNRGERFAISGFLNANMDLNGEVTNEVENFAKNALVALINGFSVNFEDQIINNLTEKEKCVYDKLTKLNLFISTIKKFEKNSKYNLIIKRGNCKNTDTGCTDGGDISNGNITITMEEGVNGRPLDFASDLLHEGIHAEIFKFVDEHRKGIDPNNRENLMYYYWLEKQKGDPRYFDTNYQHQHMADNYIKPLTEALRKLDNYNYPLDYYLGFAWTGLHKYGFDDYWDNGKLVKLTTDKIKEYEKNSNTVRNNTKFNGDDCK